MVARLASRQHGVVTREQMLRAGISVDEIAHRVRTGALQRVHRGVYRVRDQAPSVEARYLAAVLAGGEGARLSGLAAAYLYGLIRGPAPTPEVTTRTERRIPGVKTRRSRHHQRATRWRGIPITPVSRTLVDLAAHLPLDALARACHEAGVRYRTTPAQVDALMHRGDPGARKLRSIIEQHGLPAPETNCRAGTKRVDCRWREQQLTVELDSYRFHNLRHAWDQDRRREREAYARGDAFRRYAWSDVVEDPALMLRELRGLL